MRTNTNKNTETKVTKATKAVVEGKKTNVVSKMSEVISQKNHGDVSELRGLLAAAKATGRDTVLISIPTRLFAIDERYQTPIRTKRDLGYLINNFDEAKLLPLTAVAHEEEGLVYLVDGYGRWKATQFIDSIKYEYLDVMLILKAPKNPEERLKYEAEQYAFQNKNVAKMTPLQKHGAMRILGNPEVLALDRLKVKYGFNYVYEKGQRKENILGSYSEALRICETKGVDCLDYIFSVLSKAAFDRKSNGYSIYMFFGLKDVWTLYDMNRKETEDFLGKYLRKFEPNGFKAKAVERYPMLTDRNAVSLYMEDLIVENLGLKQSRELVNDKVIMIGKTA